MQNSLISQVRTNLERCGYSKYLLRSDYTYEDSLGEHALPLAGFAKPVYDSRTSCISVIKCDQLLCATEEYVAQFRGFGAPVIFACCNGTLQWWKAETHGVKCEKTISKEKVEDFFSTYKEKLSPDSIWRAKNLGRVDTNKQLSFVDIGLMPLLEHEMGERLGGLMNRVLSHLHSGFTDKQLNHTENQRWIFRAGFWLLCAKILKDKEVNGFIRLDLDDIDNVLKTVEKHYRANPNELVIIQTKRQKQALKEGAGEVKKFGSLSNLTTEAFAYMYENVLVDKKLRVALGIHATPSYLVDYIVWQLWPWIEGIPEDKRVVLEPACGHAPFLTAAMRMLRFSYSGKNDFHEYATHRLIGIETDSFAREIARLSLTLADVPNPNGWNIVKGDVYQDDLLRKIAEKSTILLCNPPFEDFKPAEQDAYKKTGSRLNCFNKAAELLWRTLPYMKKGDIFGVILPRGFLDKKNLADLRRIIVNDFELRQICHLPKGVFRYANHESIVVLGKRTSCQDPKKCIGSDRVLYRHVSKNMLVQFREKYKAIGQYIQQSKFAGAPFFALKVIEFNDIWKYCEIHCSKLESIIKVGKGFEYKGGKKLPKETETYNKKRFPNAVKGYALFNENIKLHEQPDEYWMNLDPVVIRRPGFGIEEGQSQILMNYAPVSEEPWRLKALIDTKGHPATSRFLIFRLKDAKWSLNALWAILNSPLANAFVYSHTTDRDIPKKIVKEIPIPVCSKSDIDKLDNMVKEYFRLMVKCDSGFISNILDKTKQLLQFIDAEVMHLYDLPPKMEKRILDLFQGVQRKGVDFDFTGYYSENFESAVPLHEYLSEEYQRSTILFADEWIEEHRSPEINQVLEKAVEAFEEE